LILTNPRIIVLILSYDGKYLLEESVSTYLANEYDNFEVVVIDNGSSDGTKEYLEANFPAVKIIRLEKNIGYSGGFNIGLKYAFQEQRADFALITNNDVKVDELVITELVKVAITDPKIGFVIGKVYFYDTPNVLQTVGRNSHPITWSGGSLGRNEVDTGQFESVSERFLCDDIYWLVRKQVYEDVGGYNENFFLQAEDYEWQVRAKKKGYKIYYTPYAKLWHKVSMTIGKQSALKAYYDARNPMLVVLMHQTPQFFRRYFWYIFKRIMLNSIKNIIKLRLNVAFNQYKGILSALKWGLQNHQFTWRHFL
jgi:GT2 family glycosyltransferase